MSNLSITVIRCATIFVFLLMSSCSSIFVSKNKAFDFQGVYTYLQLNQNGENGLVEILVLNDSTYSHRTYQLIGNKCCIDSSTGIFRIKSSRELEFISDYYLNLPEDKRWVAEITTGGSPFSRNNFSMYIYAKNTLSLSTTNDSKYYFHKIKCSNYYINEDK